MAARLHIQSHYRNFQHVSRSYQDMTECFHPREGQVALDDILRHHRFTRDLSDDHIATLALMASEVTLGEDELVLVDGQRCKSLYLLLDGSVSVELHTRRFTVSVQALGAGQAFGWSSLLEGQDTLVEVRERE